MILTTTVTLADGVRVVVPNSLDLITPYVLLEQQDWFEDEIKFVRALLRPGDKVVDIGANHGTYCLTAARLVGPDGHVWAFEPTPSTARMLADGIAANGFGNVTLERVALSSAKGSGLFALHGQSEFNALVPAGQTPTVATEIVPVSTLDDYMGACGWQDIALLKIDAEGEEAKIIKGGARFFDQLSPLVLYEIKAENDVRLDLVEAFAAVGYPSYRLVPGLDVLVRCDPAAGVDAYILNLFACKTEAAARLAARGLLAASPKVPAVGGSDGWLAALSGLPYAAPFADRWKQAAAAGHTREVDDALALYAASRDTARPAAERVGALGAAFDRLRALCERSPSVTRLASLARVAREFGARAVAVAALEPLSRVAVAPEPTEPFLPPGARFDAVPPGDRFGDWFRTAVLEEFERHLTFSSFYSGLHARPRLEAIRDTGFGSPEMARRLSLLQQRFNLPRT
jgi:FkbM family methyltransferase